jgi:hypothetical protein
LWVDSVQPTLVVAKHNAHPGGFAMFGSSGAQDLAYANSAILIALIRQLVSNGSLTKDQAADAFDNATRTLQPLRHLGSIAAAMRIVDDVRQRVAA